MGLKPHSPKIQRLLLLYIAREFAFPLTEEQFLQIIIDNDYMDYIEFKDNLNHLLQNNQVKIELVAGLKAYKITEDGSFTLDQFKHQIPDSQIETFENYIKNNLHQIKSRLLLDSNYKILEDGTAEITCNIREKDSMLLSMQVYIGDKATAKAICKNWETASPVMYKVIMDTLLR